MNKATQIKIGILNCVTGKIIREKTVDPESAFQEAEKISRWFDKQDTFFSSRAIWKHWEKLGMLPKFEKFANGATAIDSVSTSVIVFKGNENRAEEHEFFMQRI